MRLALGTVQFGLAYGAFNAGGGAITRHEAAAILDRAGAAGIDTLDTARTYGESEAVLGAHRAADRFRVVTKVAALDGAGAAGVAASLEASLTALGTGRVGGLMMHAADDLLGSGGDAVWTALETVVARGLAGRIGASVYTVAEAAALLSRYPLGLIQLPMSVLDRRFDRAGIVDRCAAAGVEVHVRSAFLQGLLLADPACLPVAMRPLETIVRRVAARAADLGVGRAALALAPLLADGRIARVLVGVETRDQLDELIAAAGTDPATVGPVDDLASDDETVTDPRRWAR